MAYTSQAGRTPMNARLVVIASSVEDLRDKLNQWITLGKNKDIHPGAGPAELNDVFYGNIREVQYNAGDLIEGPAGKAFLADLLANNDLEKLARLWILGVEIDWSLLRRDTVPRKISLPTYPFAKERYWVRTDQQALASRAVQKNVLDTRRVTARERTEEKRKTYYASQWTLRSIAVPKEKPAVGPMLMLDVSDELFLTMKEQLQNASCSDPIVLVKPGKSFQEIGPNIYIIDPEREEHFHELIQNLKGKALLPRVILHHCSEVCNLEVKEQVTQHLNNGVYELFYLSKALMKEKQQVPLRFLSVLSSHSEGTTPLGTALGGFFKTLTLENPRYLAKVVDVQSGSGNEEMPLSEKANLVWEEIYEEDWTAQEIRYRNYMDEGKQGQARYISQLVSHTPVERELSALPLKQNNVYLITGGLGGLGLIFAEYLAKKFQSKLVLVGRSVPGVKQEEKLRQLKGHGAEILVVQADISKWEDTERVVREARARFSEINGVIHAAGVNRDSFIFNKTSEEMKAVLASKIYGTINLDVATGEEKLDFFVLFSSIAGVMGNLGQSDYAYGNHFLDSFAETRETLRKAEKRSGRTVSIDWPLWDEGGMRISKDDIALLEKQVGLSPLPTQDGIQYWEDFLRSNGAQGIALYGTPSKIAASIAQKQVVAHKNVAAPAASIDAAVLFARQVSCWPDQCRSRSGRALPLLLSRCLQEGPTESLEGCRSSRRIADGARLRSESPSPALRAEGR